jgi:repressor LexA
MSEEIGIVLTRLREQKGKKQQEVADDLDTTQTMVSAHERGARPLGRRWLERYANYYGVSMDSLTGRAPSENEPPQVRIAGSLPVGPFIKLPLYGRIRAGMPALMEEQPDGYMAIDADFIPGDPREYIWLRIEGDSMVDAGYMPNGFALVHLQQNLDDGDIGVVIVNGDEATIKQVRFVDHAVMLVPKNSRYEAHAYPASEVKIVGKARGSFNLT